MSTMKPGHPGDFGQLLASAADLRKRFKDIDVEHDIPDGVGCNVEGTVRYIDKDLFNAVVAGEADTGLTPEQVIDCLVEHIEAEKSLADHDNGVDHWADVALLAHQAEAAKVTSFGGNIDQYDKALAPLFIACKQKKSKNVPTDLMDLGENDDVQRAAGNGGRAGDGQPQPPQVGGENADGDAGGRTPLLPS